MEVPPERRIGEWIDGRLEIKEIIGTGSYAVVYLAECHVSHKKYGIKCLHKAFRKPSQLALQREEIEINTLLRRDGHRNIVHMIKAIETETCFFLIMEYCDQPDMFELIKKKNGFDRHVVKDIFPQLLSAVAFCHGNGVYHRDLKPENVLISGASSHHCKLTDFGLATTDARPSDFGCGSFPYMSPELLQRTGATSYGAGPADVWALGVILFNMVYAQSMWKMADPEEDASFAAFVENPHNLQASFAMSEPFFVLLQRMLALDPDERCGLDEVRRLFDDIDDFVCLAAEENGSAVVSPITMTKALLHANEPSSPLTEGTWCITDPTDDDPTICGSSVSLSSDHHCPSSSDFEKLPASTSTTASKKRGEVPVLALKGKCGGDDDDGHSVAHSHSSLMNYFQQRPQNWSDSRSSLSLTADKTRLPMQHYAASSSATATASHDALSDTEASRNARQRHAYAQTVPNPRLLPHRPRGNAKAL